jgi:hypothetical protein
MSGAIILRVSKHHTNCSVDIVGLLTINLKTILFKVIFDIWLWHGDLYRVSPFQVYCTSTSCLQCDLEFFMFAVMKTFVTVISASNGRNV